MTASDLAHELGVSQRTLYRDIEGLRALGASLDGQAGIGYRLREGLFLPELAFSQDEIDALMLGLGWVRQRADPALAQGSESALSKILAAGKSAPAGNELPPLVTATSSSSLVDPPLAGLLREAIRRQHKVNISYEDAQGSLSDRIIWPLAIVYFDDVRILAAWCEKRAAFRHFRVDRLQAGRISDERYPGRRHALIAQWREQDPGPGARS